MYNIAVIYGDGVGVEITKSSIEVLAKVSEVFGLEFNFSYALAGGEALDEHGEPLPQATIDLCKNSDAVLLGSVGGPKWDNVPSDKRAERAILGLRKELELFTNIRPIKLFKELEAACPIKTSITNGEVDFVIIRELTGGIYFGEKKRFEKDGITHAYDVEAYNEHEIHRAVKTGFEIARIRNKKLTLVDKSNVLETSRLWREVANELHKEYSDVALDFLYIDNATMQVILNPKGFDVMVTSNIFGDIISDEASVLTGSIGLSPSASLGSGTLGLYEPIHGSAPDIAGKDIANPIGSILSAALMLRYSLGEHAGANAIECAVEDAIKAGCRTKDIYTNADGEKLMGTKEITETIIANIKAN